MNSSDNRFLECAHYKNSLPETALRLREFDDFEFDPMILGSIGVVFARVTLIHISDLDRFSGLGLDSLGELGDLSSILLAGSCHTQCEQVS
jgi:hypothetical protein